ncbi:MAG: DUF1858 domain-containing protein [Bacillota bacterium]
MDEKTIDLKQSVHSLCTRYPELVGILAQIGFTDITKPGMLASAGRFMTIPKGAALKKLDMGNIISLLAENGFSVGE